MYGTCMDVDVVYIFLVHTPIATQVRIKYSATLLPVWLISGGWSQSSVCRIFACK